MRFIENLIGLLLTKNISIMGTNIWDEEVLDSQIPTDDDSVVSNAAIRDSVQETDYNPDPNTGNQSSQDIIINGVTITATQLLARQAAIKQSIPENEYKKLTIQERLIIDLPVIMVKLGWLYSAYCQIHWLEASGNDVVIPYEFVTSYARVQKTYRSMLNNFAQMEYASINEYNHLVGTSFKGSAYNLMYDFNVQSTESAYYKAINFLKSINDFGEHIFGNFNLEEAAPKMNFVRSYTLGGYSGDLDDLGGSFGRFSLRVYVKGKVQDQDLNDPYYRRFHLKIDEIAFRYIDEFSFNDEQSLGRWKYDLNNPETPARTWATSPTSWIKLSNSDYRRLKNRGLRLGADYILLTAPRYLTPANGLKLKPHIIFFFRK